ncbi:MAG: hypothetical protein K5840_08465 [Eubacterium sp.]|nr:hypothetical protein [Eubacterium sp.]
MKKETVDRVMFKGIGRRLAAMGMAAAMAFTMIPAVPGLAADAAYEMYAYSSGGILAPGGTATIYAETYDLSTQSAATVYDYDSLTVSVADSNGAVDISSYDTGETCDLTLTASATNAKSYQWYHYQTQGPNTGTAEALVSTAEYAFTFIQGPGDGENAGYYICIAELSDGTKAVAGLNIDSGIAVLGESDSLGTYADTCTREGRPDGTLVEDSYTYTSGDESVCTVDENGKVTTNADATATAQTTVTVTSTKYCASGLLTDYPSEDPLTYSVTITLDITSTNMGDSDTSSDSSSDTSAQTDTGGETATDGSSSDSAVSAAVDATIKASKTKVKKGKKTTVKITSDAGTKLTIVAANKKTKKMVKAKKIKIKKGTKGKLVFTKKVKKGTYKFKVTSAATTGYNKTTKVIKIKVK